MFEVVTPVYAGVHNVQKQNDNNEWIPAFAGMTFGSAGMTIGRLAVTPE